MELYAPQPRPQSPFAGFEPPTNELLSEWTPLLPEHRSFQSPGTTAHEAVHAPTPPWTYDDDIPPLLFDYLGSGSSPGTTSAFETRYMDEALDSAWAETPDSETADISSGELSCQSDLSLHDVSVSAFETLATAARDHSPAVHTEAQPRLYSPTSDSVQVLNAAKVPDRLGSPAAGALPQCPADGTKAYPYILDDTDSEEDPSRMGQSNVNTTELSEDRSPYDMSKSRTTPIGNLDLAETVLAENLTESQDLLPAPTLDNVSPPSESTTSRAQPTDVRREAFGEIRVSRPSMLSYQRQIRNPPLAAVHLYQEPKAYRRQGAARRVKKKVDYDMTTHHQLDRILSRDTGLGRQSGRKRERKRKILM